MKTVCARGANALVAATNGRSPTPRFAGSDLLRALFTLLLLCGSTHALAGANYWDANSVSAAQGASQTMTFSFLGDSSFAMTSSAQVDVTFDTGVFSINSITPRGGASCFQMSPGVLRIAVATPGTPLPDGANPYCDVDFRVNPAAPPMTYTIGLVNPVCTNDVPSDTMCGAFDGSFTVSPAGNGPSCPVFKIGGDNQSGSTGTMLSQPLAVKQAFFSPTPPGVENFTWQITSGDAVFQSSGGTTTTDSQPYSLQSGNLYDAVSSQTIVLGSTPGPVTVIAQSQNCQLMSAPPATFNATATAVATPTMTKVSGDDQTGNPGQTLAPMVVLLDDGQPPARAPAPGVSVTYTIVSGDAVFAENGGTTHTTVTDSGGQAQSTLTLGASVGSVTVDVAAVGYPTQTFTATSVAAPVKTTTKISGDNQTGAPNTALAPMVVELKDGGAPPMPAQPVTFTISSGTATFVENGSTTYTANTDASGQAQATLQLGATPGTVVVDVTATTYPSAQFTATIAAPTPTMTKVGGDGQVGSSGQTLQPMAVALDNGGPASGVAVTYTILSGDAVIAENGGASYTTTSDGQGNAFASLTLGPTSGQVSVQVSATGYNNVTFTATNTGTFVAGTIRVVSGDNQTTSPLTEFPQPLVVQLEYFGPAGRGRTCITPVDEPVTFSITGPAEFVANGLRTITVRSDANAQASVRIRADRTTGPVSVDVTSTTRCGDLQPATASLTVAAPTRTLTKVSGDGQVGFPGARGQPLVVEAAESGTPLAGQQIQWRVTTVFFGSGVTLDGTQSTTGTDGRASMGFTFGSQPTQAQIEAREPSGVATLFTVSSQGSARIVFVGGSPNGAAGSSGEQLTFRLETGGGAPLAGETLSFSVVQGDGTVSPATVTTDSAGLARVTLTYGNAPGSVVVRASAFMGSVTLDSTFTAFAATMSIVSGDGQSAPPGTQLQPFVIQIAQPPAAKGLGGVAVTWTVVGGGGTLSTATTTTDANGRSSNTYTLGAQPGANQVRASIPGGASIVFNATATGPSGAVASVIEIVSGNNQTLATGVASEPLLVRVSSATGVRVQQVCVNWEGSDGVVVSDIQTTTNNLGETQITVVLTQPGPATVTASVPCAGNVPPVTFTLNGAVASIDGLEQDQQQVAEALDSACPAIAALSNPTPAQQDLLAQCQAIGSAAGTDPADAAEVLDQLVVDEAAAQNQAALDAAAAQFNNLKARIAALRSGTHGTSFTGLAIAGGNGVLPLSFLPSNIVQGEDEGGGTEAGADFSRWGFFASGTIGRGDRDAGENAPGFDFDTYGLTAGVDYRYSDSLIFGVALGYTDVDTDIDGDQGDLQTTGYSLSGYTTFYKGDSWYADAVATWGRNSYDLTRRIRYTVGTTSVDQVAKASPDGNQSALAVSLGRDFVRGPWSFGPYGRVTYTRIDFDTYTERLSNPSAPGGGLAMTVEGRDLKSLEGVLGGKASYTMSTSWGVMIPHLQLEWLHEFEDDPENLVSRFANDPTGAPIVIESDALDQNYFNLGLGLSGVFANGRSAFLYYEHRAGQTDFSSDSLAIGIRIEF